MEEFSNKEEIHTLLVYYVNTCVYLLWDKLISRVGTMHQSPLPCNRNMGFLSHVPEKHFPLSFSYNIMYWNCRGTIHDTTDFFVSVVFNTIATQTQMIFSLSYQKGSDQVHFCNFLSLRLVWFQSLATTIVFITMYPWHNWLLYDVLITVSLASNMYSITSKVPVLIYLLTLRDFLSFLDFWNFSGLTSADLKQTVFTKTLKSGGCHLSAQSLLMSHGEVTQESWYKFGLSSWVFFFNFRVWEWKAKGCLIILWMKM